MFKTYLVALLFTAALPSVATAQTATPNDALRACISASMTPDDSVTTARWLFIAMSRHPGLPQGARVSDADGLDANRSMGALINRLLFETCPDETRGAIEAQGQQQALNAAFNTLGEKAMTDLMTNADVMASIIQLGAYVDQQRFNALTNVQ